MWKVALTLLAGILIGVSVTVAFFYHAHSQARQQDAFHVRNGWSSADKEWVRFAEWLRHGGRKLILHAAFSVAEEGLTEDEVRTHLGPPDLVLVGPDELKGYQVVRMKNAKGAYLYKIGRFAQLNGALYNDVFAIVFDERGKVISRLGFGEYDGSSLANLDTDTRSDRRVAQ